MLKFASVHRASNSSGQRGHSSYQYAMTQPFDPYYKWLGIPPEEQPPNYYRLIGVSPLEADPDVIDAACDQRMAFLHQCATGPHAAQSQSLLNEITAARLCLFDPAQRAAYNAQLTIQLREGAPEVDASAPPSRPGTTGTYACALSPDANTSPSRGKIRFHKSWLFWILLHCFVVVAGWSLLLHEPARRTKRTQIGRDPNVSADAAAQHRKNGSIATTGEPAKNSTAPREIVPSPRRLARRRSEAAIGTARETVVAASAEDNSASSPQMFVAAELPSPATPTKVRLADAVVPAGDAPEFTIDSDAAALELGEQFQIVAGNDAGRWTVALRRGGSAFALADLSIGDGALYFQWLQKPHPAQAEQLANCLLRYTAGSARRQIALRKPLAVPPLILTLDGGFERQSIDLVPLPNRDSLYLEVVELHQFPLQAALDDSDSFTQLDKKDIQIVLKEFEGATIRVGFDARGKTGVSVKASLLFLIEGRSTSITAKRIERMRREIPEELAAANNELRLHQRDLPALQRQHSRVSGQSPRTLLEVAQKSAILQGLQRKIQSTEKSIERLSDRIPKLQRQHDVLLPSVERLGTQLRNAAALRYRIYAKVGNAEVELVRAGMGSAQ